MSVRRLAEKQPESFAFTLKRNGFKSSFFFPGGSTMKFLASIFIGVLIFAATTAVVFLACVAAGLWVSNSISGPVPTDVESVAPLALNPFPIFIGVISGLLVGPLLGAGLAAEFTLHRKKKSKLVPPTSALAEVA